MKKRNFTVVSSSSHENHLKHRLCLFSKWKRKGIQAAGQIQVCWGQGKYWRFQTHDCQGSVFVSMWWYS